MTFPDGLSATGVHDVHLLDNDGFDIRLPAPIVFGNFDSVAEGAVPAGWTRRSFSAAGNRGLDLGNLDSAAYPEWTVVEASRFNGTFVTCSDPDVATWNADCQRVNRPNPANVVGGRVLREPPASGRFLFGSSGYRNGSGQLLCIQTPDFGLSGRTDLHLSFHSLWERKRDSMAAAGYSIDGGTTWRPVAHHLVASDIVRNGSGEIDAAETFSLVRGVVAATDPTSAPPSTPRSRRSSRCPSTTTRCRTRPSSGPPPASASNGRQVPEASSWSRTTRCPRRGRPRFRA